jgi:AraC-like DNA-binding protein
MEALHQSQDRFSNKTVVVMVWDIHLEITDPEVYVQQLPTIVKHIPHGKEYKIQWKLARLENFDLLNVVWESGSTYTEGYTLPGKLVFTFFEGDHLFKVGAEELQINHQHLCISQPGAEIVRLQHTPYSALSIYIDESRFLSELSKYLNEDLDRPQFVQIFDRTTAYGRSLYQLVITLWNLIETHGHPLAIKNLEIAIFSTLVQGSFHHQSDLSHPKASEISIARVRETAEYIKTHLKKELTISKIAAAMQCSSRSLQTAFARHYGSSPNQFLRNCRLEAARLELLQSSKTITEVALEYGFSHPGRFAKYFQKHFGKPPSDILRNR